MDFRILGPLEVLDEGRGVALAGSRQRALLAMLLLHAGETVTTDRLIDEIWGERPPGNAAKTVQMQVSRLRKALGDSDGGRVVLTREGGYELVLEEGERLDSNRFEHLLAEGRNRLRADAPEDAVRLLEEALSLWRGEALADLAYEPFAQAEIARLGDLRMVALEGLIEARLALGRHAEVIPELEKLIVAHPFREGLRAQLMLALYRADRQADALQAYQEARAALVEELGIEPGARLRELERAILAQDPDLQLTVAATEPTAAAQPTAFVGRERELAELIGALDDAFAGRGGLFLLGGEPGIGKSRLAEELIAQARRRGARVLIGRCWEAGGAPAYWPFVQSLRVYVRESDPGELRAQLPPGAADLAQIVPELGRLFGELEDPAAVESEVARFRLFDATAELLRNASVDRPILLVLDDLHAADESSLLLLRFLARELASARVLIVGAFRDVDPLPGPALSEMLAAVAGEPQAGRLSLRGLSEGEVADYLEATGAELSSATLHGDTAGNPLFVGEIVRLLSVEGRLAVPQSVRDVIARRLTHLSERCNQVLVLASVLGREFRLDALAGLAAVPEDDLLDALDEAMAARVVTDLPGAPDRLRFSHVLIRDTLYEGLTTARRVRLHRRAVGALEELYGAEPGPYLAELAHHSLAASDFQRALDHARRAGDRALTLLAYEEAARLYENALDALDLADPDNSEARCGLLLSLGEAEGRAGSTPAAKRACLAAADIARRLGLGSELARAAAGYGGRFLWNRAWGDPVLVPLLEEGLAALPDGEVELRVKLLARLAGALRDEPSRERCDRVSSEAVELARREGSPAALAHALTARACAVLAPDRLADFIALASELREVSERIGDVERMADARFIQTMGHVQIGDMAAAASDLGQASRLADQLRQPTQLWEALSARALLAVASGRLDDAEELTERSLALGEHTQPMEAIPIHRIQRYTVADLRGNLAEVEAEIRELAGDFPRRPVIRCVLAHIHARLGRAEEAGRTLRELTADDCAALPFDQEWLYAMSLLAETCALLDDTESAPVLYELLLPWAAHNAADYAEAIRGSEARYLGLLATMMDRTNDAERHFEDALAMNERMGARPWLARTQSDYAQMLRARGEPGDRERSESLEREANAAYLELGMADELDALLADQIAYYDARAPEYDKDFLSTVGSDELEAALDAFEPAGDVLELACGTGEWTGRLLRHASNVTAVDASPRMLALAAERIAGDERVRFVQADLFRWRPGRRYDVVFFGFWLSHVPLERFESFWALVADCLRPEGRFFFIDDAHRSLEELAEGEESSMVRRRLGDGSVHRAVKVPHRPPDLEARITALGFEVTVRQTAGPFYWGSGRPQPSSLSSSS